MKKDNDKIKEKETPSISWKTPPLIYLWWFNKDNITKLTGRKRIITTIILICWFIAGSYMAYQISRVFLIFSIFTLYELYLLGKKRKKIKFFGLFD